MVEVGGEIKKSESFPFHCVQSYRWFTFLLMSFADYSVIVALPGHLIYYCFQTKEPLSFFESRFLPYAFLRGSKLANVLS